jgi:ABC-2 type transport system permease protein
MSEHAAIFEPSGLRSAQRLTFATARRYLLRFASRPIMLIRAPIQPVLFMLGYILAYEIAGTEQVAGGSAVGFLFIGLIGIDAWSATVWGSGYAFQTERHEGTIEAMMLSPGSRAAIVLGNGLGPFIFWTAPSLTVALITALLFGADFNIHDPFTVLVAFLAVYGSSLCIGFAFSGLFILTRQANAMANFLQTPIFLLAGFVVPRSALPDWLATVSNVIPIAHAVDALRAAALSGASLVDIWRPLLACAATSVVFIVLGLWGLKRVGYCSNRLATLDLTA